MRRNLRIALLALLFLSSAPDLRAFLSAPLSAQGASRLTVSGGSLTLSAIRGIHDYDASFSLSEECATTLQAYLRHPDMIKEVSKQAVAQSAKFQDGMLFQPVPYSAGTPFGMPATFEEYHLNPDFAIVNVPPVVMFKSKIFKPSRLCAVFRVEGRTEAHKEDLLLQRSRAMRARLNSADAAIDLSDVNEDDIVSDDDVWTNLGDSIKAVFDEAGNEEDDDVDLDSLVV
jgi:hypothetical protein